MPHQSLGPLHNFVPLLSLRVFVYGSINSSKISCNLRSSLIKKCCQRHFFSCQQSQAHALHPYPLSESKTPLLPANTACAQSQRGQITGRNPLLSSHEGWVDRVWQTLSVEALQSLCRASFSLNRASSAY